LCARNTYLQGSETVRSIDGYSLIPSNKRNGRKGTKDKKKKKRIGVAADEKGDSSLFFLSFFDAVATLLSLSLIIQE
jgi:hypothetical protein